MTGSNAARPYQDIVENALAAVGARFANLSCYDSDRNEVYELAWAGGPNALFRRANDSILAVVPGWDIGAVRFSADVNPLVVGGAVASSFAFHATEAFDAAARRTGEASARQAALTLENNSLSAALREQDIRRASHLLRPGVIKMGLVPALHMMAERVGPALTARLPLSGEVS